MNENQFQLIQERQRSNWVRLRTLVLLRWFAILGQIIALVAAFYLFQLNLEYVLASITVAASVLANVASFYLFPENRRLTEKEATTVFIFDIAQLGLLLGITGGLNNPFALLILAPVTIASTALRRKSMLVVGAIAILITTTIAQFHLPILSSDNKAIVLPELFLFGNWAALTIGVVFLAGYTRRVTTEMHAMGDALLATQMALSREQKLTDLGGVVAATAHELGTPLATIKLVSSEMAEDYAHVPNLLDDVDLIREQTDRCRTILRNMGRAGKHDLHLDTTTIEAIVREAAEPHLERGKKVLFDVAADIDEAIPQPIVYRRPEIIHGLRNLVQNAVDFADERVEISVSWNNDAIEIRVADDGPGYPMHILNRIGEPFVGGRSGQKSRQGYQGMGLGLFIAKTLLERSTAKLSFTNEDAPYNGANVTVYWKRSSLEVEPETMRSALGENTEIKY